MISLSVSHQNASAPILRDRIDNFYSLPDEALAQAGSLEFSENREGFVEWMERLNYAKHTIQGRKRHLGRFLTWITTQGIEKLEEVKKEHLESYNEYLHTLPFAKQTLESHIGALRLFDTYRHAFGKAPVLTTELKVSRELHIERAVLSVSEINQLFEACSNDLMGKRDQAILVVYYGCGLRSREGRHLEQKDINFDTGLMRIRKGKGYKERYVPMSSGVIRTLREWIGHYHPVFCPKSNIILPGRSGNRIKGEALNKRLKKLAEKADIDKRITLHVLRHSIATHLSKNGMPLESIGMFLGHATIQTTIKYVHVAEGV